MALDDVALQVLIDKGVLKVRCRGGVRGENRHRRGIRPVIQPRRSGTMQCLWGGEGIGRMGRSSTVGTAVHSRGHHCVWQLPPHHATTLTLDEASAKFVLHG